MIVDDDNDIVELTRLILEGGGYHVCSAGSGREALSRVHDERPDLILLDINMPEMDGWQVLKVLKLDETTRAIPVAMFSIRGEVRDRVRGIQDGACDYVAKPFTCDELLGRVSAIFQAVEQGRASA
jgi:two-component system alkaline phosphatase synthesis response regulator PhoP